MAVVHANPCCRFWGDLSDKIGRRPVLFVGCMGTIASLLIVGLSQNFMLALFGRLLGGVLNGNIGVIQTMVSELVVRPEHECKHVERERSSTELTVLIARAYAVMPFVWTIGSIIGPSIGGCFAEPAKSFPDIFPEDGIFARFPYLLPNLICAGLMLVSVTLGWLLLEETCQREASSKDAEGQKLIARDSQSTLSAGVQVTQEGYGTFASRHLSSQVEAHKANPLFTRAKPRVLSHRVLMLTIALGIFTYHSMTYDHLLPIFLQDRRLSNEELHAMLRNNLNPLGGGLGMTTQQTGVVLSVNGIIALAVQGVVFPLMADWLGIWRLFTVVTIGHPLAYLVMPVLTLLPDHLLSLGLYACLALRSVLSILAYPALLILIKEAAPSKSCLGKINGLAASTGAACRTLASPVAGFLYGLGIGIGCTAIAWWASALIAAVGALQLLLIKGDSLPAEELQDHSILYRAEGGMKKSPTITCAEIDSGYNTDDELSVET